MSIGSNRSGPRAPRESMMSSFGGSGGGARASVMSTKSTVKGSQGAGDGRIQVAIRCRPLNSKEKSEGSGTIWKFQPQHVIELEDDCTTATGKTHAYDNVFGPDVDTVTLFETQCKPNVRSALDGYNGTIFAYGQTSSGKTYTLMGNPQTNPGVSILAMDEIFDFISKNTHMEWDTHASYIEIYNESVTDLLQRDARKGKNLKVIEDKVMGATVKDLTEVCVLNRRHCLDLILDGEKRRSYAATNMNENSSRSHTLFKIRIEARTAKNDKCSDNMRDVASEFLGMQQKLTADHASLYLVDRTTNELFIQAGEITLRLPMSQGIAGAAATTGKTINIIDAYEDDRFNRSVDLKTGYRTKSILCMPIQYPDKDCVGVVQFINKMRPGSDGFDKNDEQLVAGLTQRLGPLISSAQRHATQSIMSRLNLVDLAGSERASKTGASGGVLKQAGYINQSLHTLGACIAILSERKKQHVPFRDSKLTQLLSSSLGGNAKTCLICAVSPASSNRGETISTLQFASRAKQVVNSFQRNCKQDQTELVSVYEAEIARLKAQLLGGVEGAPNGAMDYTAMLEASSGDAVGKQLTAQFRGRMDHFSTDVAEADVLANKSLGNAGYRIELKPMVASEGGENEDPKLIVAVGCTEQGNNGLLQSSTPWKPTQTWIAEEELYSRLAWLRKQDASGMLLAFAKHGRNAWDSAGAALGSGARPSAPAAVEEDISILENVMTREQERKHWQAKNRKLENQLILLRTYVQHINTEVKRTSQLTEKLHDRKKSLFKSSSWSSL